MEGIIGICTGILILFYIGVAVYVIWKRRTVAGTAAAAVGFLGGGLLAVPVLEAVATFVCWTVVILVVLGILGAMFGG